MNNFYNGLIIFVFILYCNYNFIFYTRRYTNTNYISRLLYYNNKYKNCKNTTNILNCGMKFEGYKKEQSNTHPIYYLTNLSSEISVNKNCNAVACNNKKYNFLIGITSAPNFFLHRTSFRLSYNKYNYTTTYYFFTGLSANEEENKLLINEQKHFNDIVIFDFISSYFNSSLLMVLIMKWVKKKCNDYIYFIYHTSDVYFNINLFINQYNNTCYNYIAKVMDKSVVIRNSNNRFFFPYSVLNFSKFPPYPSGPLIVISSNVILNISNFKYERIKNIWIDDVVLGMIFSYLNIKGKNLNNAYHLYPTADYLPNMSFIKHNLIYIHSLPPGSIFFLHNNN